MGWEGEEEGGLGLPADLFWSIGDDDVILGSRCSLWAGAGSKPDFAFCLGLEALQMFQAALPSFPAAFTPCSYHTHGNRGVLVAL